MLPSRIFSLFALSGFLIVGFLIVSHAEVANAQIVRRFGGGGVQIRAPFVRVNVGPGGATSVRAPFVAVDNPGRTYVGRRRRFMAQPRYAAPSRHATQPGAVRRGQIAPQKTPDVADVDELPYPTADELAAMEDTVLVETLRQMMARLHYRLSRLNTGEGWQKYLVLSRDILGSPGAPPEAAQFDAVQKILPRYRSVQDDPQFAIISSLPSFVATFAALQETDRRFGSSARRSEGGGPEITAPNNGLPTLKQTPTDQPLEVLPTPTPAVVPNATRGERSILKRK